MDMGLKEKVEKALEDVRTFLQQDGGDCEVVDVDNGKVTVRLQGACRGCPFASVTLKMRVERIIKERVPEVTEVVAAEEPPAVKPPEEPPVTPPACGSPTA